MLLNRSHTIILIALTVLTVASMKLCQGADSTYQLLGDDVTYSKESRAIAKGNVVLEYQGITIYADSLIWDVKERTVTGSGNVQILSEERHLRGETLSLNLDSNKGQLFPARGEFHRIFLQADKLEFHPQLITAYAAKITTCDADHPHFQIAAHKVDIYLSQAEGATTADRVETRGAGLIFRGRRLLSLPPFGVTLNKESSASQRSLPLPYPGYSSPDGIFIAYRWREPEASKKIQTEVDLRTTTKRGTRAAIYAAYALTQANSLRLTLSRREDLTDKGIGPNEINSGLSKVLVSRQPELALHIGTRPLTESINWEGQISTGHYRESPTGVSADRTALTGRLNLGPFLIGEQLSLRAATAYRLASYSNGKDSGVLYNRITFDMVPSQSASLSLSLINRDASGTTPFLFDSVDLNRELSSEAKVALNDRWHMKILNRYDLQQNHTRDNGIDLGYRAHCLEYSLGWRQNRGLLQFGIGLVMPTEMR